jgi:hypothetical protein
MPHRTLQTHTPLEVLVVEQALLLARQLHRVADDAADGQVLAAVGAAAVPAGRELTRRAVEAGLVSVRPGCSGLGFVARVSDL